MAKDKLSPREIRAMEKRANAKGDRGTIRRAAQQKAARNAASRRAAPHVNNPDDEEPVQIHKRGR